MSESVARDEIVAAANAIAQRLIQDDRAVDALRAEVDAAAARLREAVRERSRRAVHLGHLLDMARAQEPAA